MDKLNVRLEKLKTGYMLPPLNSTCRYPISITNGRRIGAVFHFGSSKPFSISVLVGVLCVLLLTSIANVATYRLDRRAYDHPGQKEI